MGRNFNTAADPKNNNEAWKASGFLNLYLPTVGGGRVKLGAIPLKEGKPNEKAILEWLKEDDEEGTRLKAIVNKLEFEYRSAEPAPGSALDLG